MKRLFQLVMVGALAASATGLTLTGCGSSSGGSSNDGGSDSKGDTGTGSDSQPPPDGSGKDGSGDSSTDTGVCFPDFVINLINNDTKSTLQPVPIPNPCADNPPGAAQDKEFNSLFP
jgi:hypothetical protein